MKKHAFLLALSFLFTQQICADEKSDPRKIEDFSRSLEDAEKLKSLVSRATRISSALSGILFVDGVLPKVRRIDITAETFESKDAIIGDKKKYTCNYKYLIQYAVADDPLQELPMDGSIDKKCSEVFEGL